MDGDPNKELVFSLSVVITGIFCLFGLIGNILTLIVLVKDKNKNSNVYLLSALAVSDWLMLVFIVNGVVVIHVCKYIRHMTCLICMQQVLRTLWALGCTVQLATAWCVVAVTWDRVMAISKPFKAMKKTEHVNRAKKLIVFVFMFSVTFNLPRWFHFNIVGHEHTLTTIPHVHTSNQSDIDFVHNRSILHRTGYVGDDTQSMNTDMVGDGGCRGNISFIYNLSSEESAIQEEDTVVYKYLWQNKVYHYFYYIVMSWLFYYIIPICSLIILNSILIRQIRMCVKNQREIAPASKRRRRDSISITINIVAVVTIFVICQIPDFIYSLITGPDIGIGKASKAYLGSIAYVFLAFNSSINFGVYCLFYGRFRKRLLAMFCPRLTKQDKNRLLSRGVSLTSQTYV